ncbi:DUF2884 family protein [Frateuria hangzhouensis]|uniref:DUF2884 family protein n=1 Tax=Frateuria hangzhouensis TaxID=2995589 RepID=UPI002260ACAD|nr:DUF2884 family protein [Frateuria sp. STR12]MCX7512781.1 DUF2884 family protein [Frateuria sp. STR12]
MRPLIISFVLAAGLAVGMPAQAGVHVGEQQCSFETDYDVLVKPDGITFEREDGTPGRVFMHDGAVRVDGRELAVSAGDARRLREYEGQVRSLLPEVASIAREGVDIGFDALTTVVASFAEDPDERSRLTRELNVQHKQALAKLDNGLGSGQWRQHGVQDLMENQIGDAVSTLVSTVTAKAVKAALSGDESQVAALEARADSLDHSIETQVNARADKLGERAEALCPRLARLDELQQQFEFRLKDGSRLALVEHQAEHDNEASAKTKPEAR